MKIQFVVILLVLISASLACKTLTGEGKVQDSTQIPAPAEEALTLPTSTGGVVPAPTSTVQVEPSAPVVEALETQVIQSEFPLPEDLQNFLQQMSGGINFQTSMSLDEAVAFYRAAFSALGLSERQLLAVVEEDVFSMVFDGASNGMSVIIQGVRLGDDSLNINIRYEDV